MDGGYSAACVITSRDGVEEADGDEKGRESQRDEQNRRGKKKGKLLYEDPHPWQVQVGCGWSALRACPGCAQCASLSVVAVPSFSSPFLSLFLLSRYLCCRPLLMVFLVLLPPPSVSLSPTPRQRLRPATKLFFVLFGDGGEVLSSVNILPPSKEQKLLLMRYDAKDILEKTL